MKRKMTKLLGAIFSLLLVPSMAQATITATWDFAGNSPSGIQSATNYGSGVEKYIDSTIDGVQLYVNTGTSGKFSMNGGTSYIQMNTGTIVRVPVVSTQDIVTISFAGNSGYCTLSSPHTATAEEVENGYVEFGASENSTYINSISVQLAYKPVEIAAKWTFDTGYDINGLICTPNSSEWAPVPATNVQAKGNSEYKYVANTRYQSDGQYYAYIGNDDTGSTYYNVMDNNGYGRVLYVYPYGGTTNNINDYTNPSQHVLYYEFIFPTIGLKDISVSVEFTFYNDATKTMELVYSTDGGTTWTDAGSMLGGANWYTYNTVTKNVSAENKDNVIIRLLPENSCASRIYLNSLTVKGKRATTPVTVSAAKYATYYNSIPVQLPEGLEAATVDGETAGTLTFNWRYGKDDVIPGGTPVLLKATAADTYHLIYAADNATAAPTGNLLHGSDAATTTNGGGTGAKYYALMNGANGLGFYWNAANGAAFSIAAHKAWLVLPAGVSAPSFSIDGEATGISEKVSMNGEPFTTAPVYNLNGQRVAQPTRGFYIVNGKKYIVK